MTTEAPEFVYGLSPAEPGDALVRAINRLAQAIEQATLAKLDSPVPSLAPLPPVRPPAPQAPATANCPTHNQPWKWVPPGRSNRTGANYEGFWACPQRGCDQRPPR